MALCYCFISKNHIDNENKVQQTISNHKNKREQKNARLKVLRIVLQRRNCLRARSKIHAPSRAMGPAGIVGWQSNNDENG